MYKTVEELASALSARLGLEVKIESRGIGQYTFGVYTLTGVRVLSVDAYLHSGDGVWRLAGWGGQSDMSDVVWDLNHPDEKS